MKHDSLLFLFIRRHARARLILWLAVSISAGAALAAHSLHRGVLRRADQAVAALGGENVRLVTPAPLSFLGLDLASLRSEPFPEAAAQEIRAALPDRTETIRVPADAVQLEATLFGQTLSTETALLILPDDA